MSEPIIAVLEECWTSLAALSADFTDDDWNTPTELPGWSVKDCYSHIVGTERSLQGAPPPQVDLSGLDYLTAPSAPMTEPTVHARRATPGADVRSELIEVAAERISELSALTPEQWEEIGFTPSGPGPHREFMNIRGFDCWMHEQDVRRALGRPGHTQGIAAEHSMGRLRMAMGYVVGKKAGAPDGSSVVLNLTGPMAQRLAVVVDGRATVTDDIPPDPTVTITLSTEAYWCLGGGRWDPAATLHEGAISFTGDADLGRHVIEQFNFMI